MATLMDQWLHQQRVEFDDGDLNNLAAWLEGNRNDRQASRDRVELLLASDPQWLGAALALPGVSTEPVPAEEVLSAQALVGACSARVSLLSHTYASLRQSFSGWQPMPIAFAATIVALVTVGSFWVSEQAAIEFGVDDMQSASMLDVTRLDFGANPQFAINDAADVYSQ